MKEKQHENSEMVRLWTRVTVRVIVVLAGLHNSLRSQTQLRLDEGFLGFDTQQGRTYDQTNRRIGVGRLPGEPPLAVNSMTNSEGEDVPLDGVAAFDRQDIEFVRAIQEEREPEASAASCLPTMALLDRIEKSMSRAA